MTVTVDGIPHDAVVPGNATSLNTGGVFYFGTLVGT